MWSLRTYLRYLHYYFTAANGKGHGIHSPFVFAFVTELLNDNGQYDAYGKLACQFKHVVRSSSSFQPLPDKYRRLLFRIANYYAPEKIWEVGSAGAINAAYMAAARPQNEVLVLGAGPGAMPDGLAGNIQPVCATFDASVRKLLDEHQKVDCCVVDMHGFHGSVTECYHSLLPAMHADSVLIIANMHREDTRSCWAEVIQQPEVTVSIDLFCMGLLFFRKQNKVKQHFTIRF